MTDNETRAYFKGVRACIAWLHQYADTMNDPHARAVLNTAAHGLGVSKPQPATPTPETKER